MAKLIRLIKELNLDTLQWQLTETIHNIEENELLSKKLIINASSIRQDNITEHLEENDKQYLLYLESTLITETPIEQGIFKHRITAELIYWKKVNSTFKKAVPLIKDQQDMIYIELVEREAGINKLEPQEINIKDSLEFYHPIFILSVTES